VINASKIPAKSDPQVSPVESPLSSGVCSAEFNWAGAGYKDAGLNFNKETAKGGTCRWVKT